MIWVRIPVDPPIKGDRLFDLRDVSKGLVLQLALRWQDNRERIRLESFSQTAPHELFRDGRVVMYLAVNQRSCKKSGGSIPPPGAKFIPR